MGVRDHECNAYCSGDEHAIVIYADSHYDSQFIKDELIKYEVIEILSLDIAREAPKLESVINDYEDIKSHDNRIGMVSDFTPWLLRYRAIGY